MTISIPEQGGAYKANMSRGTGFLLLLLVSLLIWAIPAQALITVTASGPGGSRSQTLPDSGGEFDMNLPLSRNAVNTITVSATDAGGQKVSQELKVTQLSLDQIVVSQVTAERLSVEQIKQLVSDGVIKIDNPANFNVSKFDIVLTIGSKPVPISVAIPTAIAEEVTGYEEFKMPDADNAGPNPPPAPTEIIVFDQPIPSEPGQPQMSIPGVIIIEGNIKSLKEFYTVRLLLMNTSGIFTLKNVISNISFPDGGLTSIAPADGIISFGDILPGDGGLPGQAERQFIIRGDEIGIRQVKVGFGGTVAGPGIPEESPVPFNGSAFTKVEVKGPPTFRVRAIHPDAVETGVPYEFRVEITNTGDIPALYSSLDLSVGADGTLVSCDTATPANCTELGGTETRTFGDILPGKTVSALFMIKPSKTGQITSCLGVSDQNISLQVLVGTIGCLVGQLPPERGVPDGTPTVSLVPAPNTQGVGISSAVAAFFSQQMDPATITTGNGGTFNVFDRANNIVPGAIRQEILNGKTVAIWQVQDGITNRLAPNVEYTIVLTRGIANVDGVQLYNAWTSRFTTTGEALDDVTPPTLTMAIDPPVNPSYVLPGQLVKVDAYAADQGSGVVRVELRLKDLTEAGSSYQLVDRKVVFSGDLPPYLFTVDSAKLMAGHTYQLMATAYDYMMNAQNATINLVIAATAAAPTITLPESPSQGIAQGISVSITPESITGGVNEVRYYLDGATAPFKSVNIPPYQAGLGTLTLALGNHTIRAVAVDALGQTGEATYTFELVANPNKPQISLNGAVNGATYIVGSSFVVSGSASDPVGIASVSYSVDGTVVANADQSFTVVTAGLSIGSHTISATANNILGQSTTLTSSFNVADLPNGPAPAAPVITTLSLPANGNVTLAGSSAAGARIDITNLTQQFGISINANDSGLFSGAIAAASGDQLRLIAYDYTSSQQPSPAATATVSAPPVLTGVSATPGSMNFSAANAWQDISVTGNYDNGSNASLTNQATYSSSDSSVASVNTGGRVVALKSGSTVITVSYGGMTAQVAVTVDIVTLTSISVEPPSLDFTTIGQARQLVVTGHYSNNTTQTLANGISFVSGENAVATVSLGGLVAVSGNGLTQVTAYFPGVQPVSVPVSVNSAGDTVPQVQLLSPASGSTVQRGESVSVTVRATDAVGGVSRVVLSVREPGGQAVATETRQISPALQDVASPFTFKVPDNLAIGSILTVTAGAEDTGNQSALPVAINLTVVDTTAPIVSITSPAPQTPYNYGDTITVSVHAEDLVGVSRISYVTSGAFVSSASRDIAPSSSYSDATFTISVPFGATSSELRITASALDLNGNKGISIPTEVIITSADITPSATRVMSVAAPGAGPSTSVTYEVTSGLSDLDHVELYFRRNGIGTFNRYTDADHGNPDGKYLPTSGNSGSITFDSTKMGGDGTYEFYSVGVDKAGNRESAPGPESVVPDQSATFNAGTAWTVIASPATAGEGDTTYDNQNIRVVGTTFTVNGAHSFHNVELLNGAVLTHAPATTSTETRLDATAWSISIDSGSAINTDGKGYLGGRGWHEQGRTVGNVYGGSDGAGGSYGGLGGGYQGRPSNSVYGYLTDPDNPGSGGGAWDNEDGGNGGGLIKLRAINIAVDGEIRSNGGESAGSAAGDGSGGGINITTTTISGRGSILANGGGSGNGTGGGGGRIAVRNTDVTTLSQANVKALGGFGYYGNGANGTVVFIQPTKSELVLTGQGPSSPWTDLTLPPGYVFDSVTFRDNARVIAHDTFTVTGKVLVTGNSILTHETGKEAGLVINARTVQVDEGSAIDTTGQGYSGGRGWHEQGRTLGNAYGGSDGTGGSYGGTGSGYQGRPSGPIYGDPKNPVFLGSGGGAWDNEDGGNGGGRITINALDAVIVNGTMRANGGESAGSAAGDGSGGSVLIKASKLAGTGSITANGGGNGNGTGGGGGRIAIYCDYVDPVSNFNGLRTATAFGGTGYYDSRRTTPGTVFIKYSNQENGNLFIDAGLVDGNGNPGASSPDSIIFTPIGFGSTTAVAGNTLTTDGLVAMHPNSLPGLRINPDTNQTETFVIQTNTANTITVVTPNERGISFADVAATGKQYSGSYTFDNLFFRRGGNLMLGDLLEIKDTMTIGEYGVLTHYDATAGFVSRLDVTVKDLVIEPTGRIDTTGRGYLGGRGWHEQGRSLDNVYGASDGSGGSYGGLAQGYGGRASNSIYGSLTDPLNLGSGGGAWDNEDGGDGGGLVIIRAENIRVDGAIIANGGESAGSAAGDGSGGTINIVTENLDGAGSIQANGGGNATGSGGGGGRIAVRYSGAFTLAEENIRAIGGTGQYGSPGGNGTVYLNGHGQTHGNLVIDGFGYSTPTDTTRIPGGYTFDNLTIRNAARVVADESTNINGTLHITGNSILTHGTGNEAGLVVNAAVIQIDEGSTLAAVGRGYLGGKGWHEQGRTLGNVYGASDGAGGSYGGLGGGYQSRSSHLVFGDPKNPAFLGSGGGAWDNEDGGNGGGKITLHASIQLIVNGKISANGDNGAGSAAGGGSGGSIIIHTPLLSGNGFIEANGGGSGPGGGGGRVAVFCATLDSQENLNQLRNITAFSGHGSYNDRPATAGTVYVEYTGGQNFLYIDDNVVDANGVANATASQSTPLTPIGFGSTSEISVNTLITDGLVPLMPGGLTGLHINPDVSQNETFTIQGNTGNSITVVSPNGNGILFSNIAALGKRYAGHYRFDNVIFRRGGNLVMGDLLNVTNKMDITEFGLLTHYNASNTFISRLSLNARNLNVDASGRIDVSGRGYLGGRGWYEQGRTLGNVYGSSSGAGGSYGGLGGGYQGRSSNSVYGSMSDPDDLGSGGGAWENADGGDGGGLIRINAESILLNGVISANGADSGGSAAGAGSGGTVNITTVDLTGTGSIQATGGNGGAGGGGGRISLLRSGQLTLPTSHFSVLGGVGSYGTGAEGTLYPPRDQM
jgi:hypothetical protein